jgi:CRISPR/Cas system-associated protein Cas10 (large subunit of type III CRISPR-Cas system)
MIMLGDISGIQGFVFDFAEEGGGQAQRLRARSFMVQLIAKVASIRILNALNCPLT